VRPDHFRKVGIATFDHDRLPCATGLVSYPSSCFSFSFGRPRFRCLPLIGYYCVSAVIAGHPAPSHQIAQSAMIRSLFPLRVRRRNDAAADFVRPKPPDCGSPLWLTVATFGLRLTDCVRPKVRNHGPAGRDSACSWFVRSAPLLLFASRTEAAHRLTSWSNARGGTTLPEEAGDMCLRSPSSE